jgi:tRNA A-37 threonylcarbamoyl transferase component Bud32
MATVPVTGQIPEKATAPREGRKRRPSGEAPPLPHDVQRSGRFLVWIFGGVFLLLVFVVATNSGDAFDRAESDVLRAFADVRTPFLTSLAKGINVALGSLGVVQVARWVTILVLLAFKRFRHLFVYLASLMIVGWLATNIALFFARARPTGVSIIGGWAGSSLPSRPMAGVAVTLLGIIYALVPPGRSRTVAKWCATPVMLVLAAARMYLAVDHPTDVAIGLALGISVPVVLFRIFTPNEIFPVTYKRGRAAHLDVGGPRGAAIRSALEDQLGLQVTEMKPFGLAGSGGSTPLRLTLADGRRVFAKLYAKNHLRADRWYKLGRTLRYGRLEDEASFSTVRRLIQYEDYMLRVMSDAGLSTPLPYGIVEITPEREYVIVMEFFDGSSELIDVEMTDELMDNALRLIRRLWDEGLAHRDIKPSNLLANGDDVHLIDVAFAQIRPSPWRQAVDLANIMLVLALKAEPETVYEHALRYFTPEEISEAFAATHGVTIPSQSRGLMKKDHRDLVEKFRELAPAHRPISIQRWSPRRIALTVAVLFAAFLGTQLIVASAVGVGLLTPPDVTQASYALVVRTPECGKSFGEQLVLMAQSVPSATQLPCVTSLPAGWSYRGAEIQSGSTHMIFDSDRAGLAALAVDLRSTCDTSGSTQLSTPDEPGTSQFEKVGALEDRYVGTRYYTFPGGCAIYNFDFRTDGGSSLAKEISLGVGFESRDSVAARYLRQTHLDF